MTFPKFVQSWQLAGVTILHGHQMPFLHWYLCILVFIFRVLNALQYFTLTFSLTFWLADCLVIQTGHHIFHDVSFPCHLSDTCCSQRALTHLCCMSLRKTILPRYTFQTMLANTVIDKALHILECLHFLGCLVSLALSNVLSLCSYDCVIHLQTCANAKVSISFVLSVFFSNESFN